MNRPHGGDRRKLSDPRVDEALEAAQGAGEQGLQVAAFVHGRPIVDTWHGEDASGHAVGSDSLFSIFSVTKAVTALAVHRQVALGRLSYEQPISEVWPEFGAHGKERVTVQDALTHRSGIPQMPEGVTPERMADWDWMTRGIASLTPLYPPGRTNAYHSYTFGWILGEAVRRSDPAARPFGTYVQEELCVPLGIDSLFLGVPQERLHNIHDLVYPAPAAPPPEDDPRWRAAPRAVGFGPATYNQEVVRKACIPGAGGIADARSVARLFALISGRGEVDGVRLLSEQQVLRFLEPRPDHEAPDPTFGGVMLVGMGGMHVHPRGVVAVRPGERIVCQVGAGSSIGWADVDSGLSFAITHNRMVVNPVMAATTAAVVSEPPFVELGDALREIAREHTSVH
ncbi:MAG: serine hydrolase domain-containing protein [Mycobacterium sp.]